jgi:hypothetical protein
MQDMEIELDPDLSCCIHTLAKREYARVARQLLDAEQEDAELCDRVELLRMFLESTDFVKLRSEYEPSLSQGKRVRFTLRSVGGRTAYRYEVK